MIGNSGNQDIERAMARSKSYVGQSVLVLVLYFVFYLPGLIFNWMFLKEAQRNEQIAGQSLPGTGCLKALLYANVIWIVFWCVIIGSITGIGAFGGN